MSNCEHQFTYFCGVKFDRLTYKQFLSKQEKEERIFLNGRFYNIFWGGEDDYELKEQFFLQADLEVARGIIMSGEKIIELSAEAENDSSINNDSRIQSLFDSHEMMPFSIDNNPLGKLYTEPCDCV